MSGRFWFVHVVKNLSINYSWGDGDSGRFHYPADDVMCGDFKFGVSVSVPGLIIAIILSRQRLRGVYTSSFCRRPSRTGYVQFEDDGYYYYVKAVSPQNCGN